MAEKAPENAAEAQARLEQLNPSKGARAAPPAPPPAPAPAAEPQQQAEPEKQDLHISEPRGPDRNWRRMQPIQITPTKQRLDAEHQLVMVRNRSDVEPVGLLAPKPQTHIVIDRYMVGHELAPGQAKQIDLLATDIDYFQRQRARDRRDMLGQLLPLHPVAIEGVRPRDADVVAGVRTR